MEESRSFDGGKLSCCKRRIIRQAFRRFLYGCPPRKKNDTSIGDTINWAWIVECARTCPSEIHIVSRDADYGITLEGKSCLNDHLRQEFKERVSKKRNIFLHTKLSEALKQFQVTVSPAEEKEETEILETKPSPSLLSKELLDEWFNKATFTIDTSKPLTDQMFRLPPTPPQL